MLTAKENDRKSLHTSPEAHQAEAYLVVVVVVVVVQYATGSMERLRVFVLYTG